MRLNFWPFRRPKSLDELLTVPAFRDWVGSRPRDQKYNYGDAEDCAVMRYLRESGRKERYIDLTQRADFNRLDYAAQQAAPLNVDGEVGLSQVGTMLDLSRYLSLKI